MRHVGGAVRWLAAMSVLAALTVVPGVPPAAGAVAAAAAPAPAPPAAAPVASLIAGDSQNCGLLVDGRVSCWGHNDRGQLGLGDEEHRGDGPGEMGARRLTVDLGTGQTATAVTIGGEHMCALLTGGSVKCWGRNDFSVLGTGDDEWRGDEPGEMGDALPAVDLGTGRTATAVAAGGYHTCAVLDDGSVKCWGKNDEGELGLGDTLDRGGQPGQMGDALPALDLGTGRTAVAITAGRLHTCALLDNGSVKCWGENNTGQLGLGNTADRGDQPGEMGDALPTVSLGIGRTAQAVVAGQLHTCALLDNATVKCWGYNTNGQLGLGSQGFRGDNAGEMGDALPAVDLGTGRSATAIATGSVHTCALLDDASVKCWGDGTAGTLGQGDTANRGDDPGEMGDALPAVSLPTGRTVTQVATRGDTCVLLDDGTVRCWGENLDGSLGLGDDESRGDQPGEMGDALAPVAVTGDGVTGRVTSATGGALPGALVAVLDPTDFAIVGGAVANADGRYTMPAPGGPHFVYAVGPSASHQPGFLGAPDVVTSAGGLPTVADVGLGPRTGAISGAVTDAVGDVPVGPGTYVLALDPTTGSPVRGAATDVAGDFTIDGLPAGAYVVAYLDLSGGHHPWFSGDAPDPSSADPVTVTAGGVAIADAALPPRPPLPGGMGLTGRVAGPAGTESLVIALRAADYSFARGGRTNGSGGYGFNVPPGQYVLGVIDLAGAYRTEWFHDQPQDQLGQATAVAAPANLDLAPDAALGSVAGTVTASGGSPVADAWVVVVRPSGVAGTAVTDPDGSYRIDGLPPDNYRAAIVDPASGARVYWPDAPDFEGGATFRVDAGTVSGLNPELDLTGAAP